MAPDQRMALTAPRRTVSNQLNKTTRQVVPAFLQKLYEMVNDPSNSHLITWSETGDSFFVLDHERFAREVLGRWFKHQNFSSFVRQLNMYGFHKIPHLQQGVLRSEKDSEFWNFAHANFQQGQPDLLVFIQRKKQVPQLGDDVTGDVRDSGTAAPTTANLSSGQLLDIHSIVNGIAAIKRHQTTISAELNELKRSNNLLWQESMATRARYQKHQDTLNRIIKFLAGVFGQNAAHVHKEDGLRHTPSRAMVPRKPSRLMIEDGQNDDGKHKVNMIEIEDEESGTESQPFERDMSPSNPEQIGIAETPQSVTSLSLPPSAPASPPITEMPTYFEPPPQAAFIPAAGESLTSPLPLASNMMGGIPTPQQPQEPQSVFSEQSITPSALTSRTPPPNAEFDHPKIQNVLNQLSPSQIQQLLASLASQTIPDSFSPSSSEQLSSSQLTSYQPPYDFTQQINHQPSLPAISSLPTQPSADGLIQFDPPLAQNTERIEKTWKATEDIDKDVNALQNSISSLIQTFGLDPNVIQPQTEQGDASAQDPSLLSDVHDTPVDPSLQDFDFDSFLNTFSNNDIIDYGDTTSASFLDEVPSPSDGTASPITNIRHDSPDLQKATGHKRKTDAAASEDGHTSSTPSGAKPKRRREK